VSRKPLSYSRQLGRLYVWYSPDRHRHEGVWHSGGNGSSLLVCDTCGLATEPRRWGTDERKIKQQFDRAHKLDCESGYRGRHRARPLTRKLPRILPR
jgi:hypothetical protein